MNYSKLLYLTDATKPFIVSYKLL